MISNAALMRPPFRLDSDMDPAEVGQAIVDCIDYFSALPNPLTSVFSVAMEVAETKESEPLYRAGMAIVQDIDVGIGAGNANAFHNKIHLCEVLLCTIAISNLVQLSAHEKALLFVAAAAHDFHHDGRPNVRPYRLESLATSLAKPYLVDAGVSALDSHTISTLILATETQTGVSIARAYYAKHFMGVDASQFDVAIDFPLLASDCRSSLLAVILAEADILPSVGLTAEHAKSTALRLAQEWNTPFTPKSKIDFIDNCVGDLITANYFMSNVRAIRHTFLTSI